MVIGNERFFQTNPEPRGISTRDVSATSRCANGGRGISVGKSGALRSKEIEVGGSVVRSTVTTEIAPTHIVRENEDYVWARFLCAGRALSDMPVGNRGELLAQDRCSCGKSLDELAPCQFHERILQRNNRK